MNAYTVSIALGILTFIFFVNIFSIRIPKKVAVQKRLERIRTRNYSENVKKDEHDIEFVFIYDNFRYKILAKYLSNFKFIESVKKQIAYSGVNMEIDSFIILSILCCVPLIAIFALTSPKLMPVSLIGLFVPLTLLKIRAKSRAEAFARQFPDTLDMLSSSLRAGHSIYSSFEVITKEMPMPVSGVFKSAMDEMAVGSDSKEAISSLSKTVPDNIDLKFFITSVNIQREVGGNLAKILDTLSVTIRERFKITGQLKAQTAQARFSGYMLVCVPPAIAGILFVVSPEYMKPLLDTQQGNFALLFALGLLLLGIYTIKKIVTIEI